MTNSSIDPRIIPTFEEWADMMVPTLETTGTVITMTHGDDWRRWASTICTAPLIAAQSPPEPSVFSDWREWAIRFVEVLGRGF